MKLYRSLGIILIAATAVTTGCRKDEKTPPPPTHETEVITTLRLAFKDSANPSSQVIAEFKDPDGEGGRGPTVFDTIRLSPSRTYFANIMLLDETKTPADTISNEVKEEAEDHHLFFHPSGVNITVSYEDKDANNLPLGLSTSWKTGNAGTGTVTIILKHQAGSKNGTEAPGETDVEIKFPVSIQ